MTKKQRKNEYIAALCDQIAGGASQSGKELRAKNRRVEKRKGRTAKSPNGEVWQKRGVPDSAKIND